MWVYRHPEELYGKGSAQSGWTKASLVVPLGVAPADLLSGRHRTVRAQVYLAHSSDGEGKEGSRHAEAGWAVMETPFEAGPRHRRSPRTRPVGLFLQTSSQCPDSLPSPFCPPLLTQFLELGLHPITTACSSPLCSLKTKVPIVFRLTPQFLSQKTLIYPHRPQSSHYSEGQSEFPLLCCHTGSVFNSIFLCSPSFK